MNKNEIVENIYNDASINKYINHMSYKNGKANKDELKQHFIEIILNKNDDWFISRSEPTFMTASCISIIRFQLIDKDSSFWKDNKIKENFTDFSSLEIIEEEYGNKHLDIFGDFIDDCVLTKIKVDHYIQFKLYYYYDLNLREIAEATGVHYITIFKHIEKVREKIKESIKNKQIK